MSLINPRPNLVSIKNELRAKGALDEHKLDHEAQQVLGVREAEHTKKHDQAKLKEKLLGEGRNKLVANLLGRMIQGLETKPVTQSQAISGQEKTNDHKSNLTITFA